MLRITIFLLSIIISLSSCDALEGLSQQKEDIVATIGKEKLTKKELNDKMTAFNTADDSINIANTILEDWIINELLFEKAIKKNSYQSKIEHLVEKYRRSLYIHDFEQGILNSNKQLEITSDEIDSYYESFKSQDLLKEPVYKLKMLIFNDGEEGLRKFENGWKKDKLSVIDEYKPLATYFQLDTSIWMTYSEIKNILPLNFPPERLDGTGYQKSKTNDKISYLHIYKKREAGEEKPLQLLKDKIKKIISHKRQKEIIERYKENLYKEAIKNKKVSLNN